MKVWITKYALSKGIYEADVEGSQSDGGMVTHRQKESYPMFFHGEGKEWHRSEDSAKATANKMVADKISSLQKQLSRLRLLEF